MSDLLVDSIKRSSYLASIMCNNFLLYLRYVDIFHYIIHILLKYFLKYLIKRSIKIIIYIYFFFVFVFVYTYLNAMQFFWTHINIFTIIVHKIIISK